MEQKLKDNYPVFPGYWYVVDGKPHQAEDYGVIAQLKKKLSAETITNCDCFKRKIVNNTFVRPNITRGDQK